MAEQDWQSEKSLSETNLHMLKSQLLADVTFLVGEQRKATLAHKFVLVSRSCVFEAMFCGPMAEKNTVEIPDVESNIFEDFLRYIYSDDVILQPDTVLPLLYVAKKYSVKGLEKKCVEFCDSTVSSENACTYLQQAYLYDEEPLKTRALEMILRNGTLCLASDDFSNLGKDCLELILKSDTLAANEIDVFKAAITWAKAECGRSGKEVTGEGMRNVLGNALGLIRFPLIPEEQLANMVVPQRVLTDAQLVSLFVRYSNHEMNIEPFNTNRRKGLHYTFTRSLNKRHRYDDTKRRDALIVSSDKDVTLHAVHLYGGDIKSSFKMNVNVQAHSKGMLLNEVSSDILVNNQETIYRVPLAVPVVMLSGSDVLLRVTCDGPKRWLCIMNGKTEINDELSGIKLKLAHSKESQSKNSIEYGLICGFDYRLNA